MIYCWDYILSRLQFIFNRAMIIRRVAVSPFRRVGRPKALWSISE
jgi:hypothetical protein